MGVYAHIGHNLQQAAHAGDDDVDPVLHIFRATGVLARERSWLSIITACRGSGRLGVRGTGRRRDGAQLDAGPADEGATSEYWNCRIRRCGKGGGGQASRADPRRDFVTRPGGAKRFELGNVVLPLQMLRTPPPLARARADVPPLVSVLPSRAVSTGTGPGWAAGT